MVLLERTGKAVRSPSKSALLAHAARPVGRGRGFAVHKALDQVGAFAGPLLVAGVIALTTHTWAGLATLAVPGAVAMACCCWSAPGCRPAVVRRGAAGDRAPAGGARPPRRGCPAASTLRVSVRRRARWG